MNKEEIIFDKSYVSVGTIYQETEEDVLNKHLYVFNEDLGTLKEIKDYKFQLTEANEKLEKIENIFADENLKNLNKYYYGDSYECDVHELRKDILEIIKGSDIK